MIQAMLWSTTSLIVLLVFMNRVCTTQYTIWTGSQKRFLRGERVHASGVLQSRSFYNTRSHLILTADDGWWWATAPLVKKAKAGFLISFLHRWCCYPFHLSPCDPYKYWYHNHHTYLSVFILLLCCFYSLIISCSKTCWRSIEFSKMYETRIRTGKKMEALVTTDLQWQRPAPISL